MTPESRRCSPSSSRSQARAVDPRISPRHDTPGVDDVRIGRAWPPRRLPNRRRCLISIEQSADRHFPSERAEPYTPRPATELLDGSRMSATAPLAIETQGLRRVYKARPKDVVALDGIDLRVEPGEFFGLLGPNGAGKTTLIKILTTLLLPTTGTARIFGFDVVDRTRQIRRIMNMVAGGEQSGYGILEVREQLWMFSQFYGLPARDGWRRVDELIDAVGLDEQRNQKVSTLSTGQRQKMNFARGLLNDPWIFFLDEPTLGLDVSAARAVRELILAWKAAVPGRTVLLTK